MNSDESENQSGTFDGFLDELVQIIRNGDATVIERDHGYIRKLRPTKIGQSRGLSAIIQEFNKILSENNILEETTTKRIYRRREELPDPSKPHWAEVNRVTKNRSKTQINLRLDPAVLALVDEAAEKRGLNRTSWMTLAFIRAARDEGIEVSQEMAAVLGGSTPKAGLD